jgi:hypothetical protein
MTNAEIVAALDRIQGQLAVLRDQIAAVSTPPPPSPQPLSGGGPGEE